MEEFLTTITPNILFDLDGTLVDSAPSLCNAANFILKQLNRPPIDLIRYKSFIGNGMLKQVEKLLVSTGGIPENDLEKYFKMFCRRYESNPLLSTTAYTGVVETLKELKSIPATLAICTQKAESPARAILSGLNLLDYFEGFAFGDSLPVLKPDPEMVFHAIYELRGRPLIYVGDSEVDALTAMNANATFLLYKNGYRNKPVDELLCYAAFDCHQDIPKLVRQIMDDFHK